MNFTQKTKPYLGVYTLVSIILFTVVWIFGKFGPKLMANPLCYNLIGCNAGFFGYDAVLHFIWGISNVLSIVWLMRRYTKYNILRNSIWENIIILVALSALVGVGWELFEYSVDQFRIISLHIPLLQTNGLAQPSNSDTIGDLTFGITGALITSILILFI